MIEIPWLPADQLAVPWLTTDQMVAVDRAMVEDFQILLIQMMEQAGRHLAHLARVRFLSGDPRGRSAVVLAGTGGNGGGALVCARRLAAWGARVTVAVAAPDGRFADVPGHQLRIVRLLDLPVIVSPDLPASAPDVVVDGIIGYHLRGQPRREVAALIDWANATGAPVLALDVPSGLDATTGQPSVATIAATATMTLAMPKRGLRAGAARPLVGELYLADIGVPPQVYARPPLGLAVPDVFAIHDLVRVW